MKTYKISFNGRQVGAIGKTYRISQVITAENEEKANLKLYDKFEHIEILNIKEIPNATKLDQNNDSFELTHEGEVKFVGSEFDCFYNLQKLQSNSANWAMKYEKWKINPLKS